MHQLVILCLCLVFISLVACAAPQPTALPTPEPTLDIPAMVAAQVQARLDSVPVATTLPTPTEVPAATRWPTYTPYPTATALPTLEPLPTYTPWPTAKALPTLEPLATYTPYPTVTPQPTYTPYPTSGPVSAAPPLPTYTPYPTATPFPTPLLNSAGADVEPRKGTDSYYDLGFGQMWILEMDSVTGEFFGLFGPRPARSILVFPVGKSWDIYDNWEVVYVHIKCREYYPKGVSGEEKNGYGFDCFIVK